MLHRFNSVHDGHSYIHEDYIRRIRLDEAACFLSVCCDSEHCHVGGIIVKECLQALGEQALVVDKQDLTFLHLCVPPHDR